MRSPRRLLASHPRARIAPARPRSLPASAPASPLSPPGSGGRPLGMAAPNPSLPPPPAHAHTDTPHTHTLGNGRRGDGGAGTSGRARPYTRAAGGGRRRSLPGEAGRGRAGQRRTHGRAGRAGGARRVRGGGGPRCACAGLCRAGGRSVHPGAAAGGARRAPLWGRPENGNGPSGVWRGGSGCPWLPPGRVPVSRAVSDPVLAEGLDYRSLPILNSSVIP